METMYDNTKKSILTNTTKENNYYYEPTIKTMRVEIENENKIDINEVEQLKRKFCKMETKVKFLQNEKQQLISFLEDKIKECDEINKTAESDFQELKITLFASKNMKDLIKQCNFSKQIYQEVLDFIKGSKDE